MYRHSQSAVAAGGLLVWFVITIVSGATTKEDVQKEIDKIAEQFDNFEQPSEEAINGFIQQIQTYCPNKTIDKSLVNSTNECLSKKFGHMTVNEDIKKAIPEGKLDEVFNNVCKQWPQARECLRPLLTVVEDCWSEGDKVNKVMDYMVKFFCGEKNDGARIALFFADGGMRCLEAHGHPLRECISEHEFKQPETLEDVKHGEVCDALKHIHDCAHTNMRQCDDPTPENLATSMLKDVASHIGCAKIPDASTSGSGKLTALAASLIVPIICFM